MFTAAHPYLCLAGKKQLISCYVTSSLSESLSGGNTPFTSATTRPSPPSLFRPSLSFLLHLSLPPSPLPPSLNHNHSLILSPDIQDPCHWNPGVWSSSQPRWEDKCQSAWRMLWPRLDVSPKSFYGALQCFLFSRPLFPSVSSASSPWLMGVLQVAHGSDPSCLLSTTAFPSGQRGTSQACAQICPSDEMLFLPNSCDALLLETLRKPEDLLPSALLRTYYVIGSCPQPCVFIISAFPVS